MYGQRDPRWKNHTLGTKGTIGNYGCTLTSICNLCVKNGVDINPLQLNEMLLKGAYANGNLIWWTKLKEATNGLVEFMWRGYKYDNAKVKEAIEKYGGCLVEVSGKRIGGSKHWVLFLGNRKAYDPWYNKIVSTSFYSPLSGYAVIKINKEKSMNYKGIDLTNQDSVKVAIDTWYEVAVENKYVRKDEANKELEECKKVRDENIGRVKELTKQVAELKDGLGKKESEIKELEAELQRVKKAHEEEVKSQVDFGDKAAKEEAKRKDLENEFNNFLTKLEEKMKLGKSSDGREARKERILQSASCDELKEQFDDLVTHYNDAVKELAQLREKHEAVKGRLSQKPTSMLVKELLNRLTRMIRRQRKS